MIYNCTYSQNSHFVLDSSTVAQYIFVSIATNHGNPLGICIVAANFLLQIFATVQETKNEFYRRRKLVLRCLNNLSKKSLDKVSSLKSTNFSAGASYNKTKMFIAKRAIILSHWISCFTCTITFFILHVESFLFVCVCIGWKHEAQQV